MLLQANIYLKTVLFAYYGKRSFPGPSTNLINQTDSEVGACF